MLHHDVRYAKRSLIQRAFMYASMKYLDVKGTRRLKAYGGS